MRKDQKAADKPKREIWHPPPYGKEDVRAIQALAQGTAGKTEQHRALKWIIETACLTYDEPFRPESSDVITYMLGRRSVGLAIVKLLSLKPENIFNDRS